MAQRTSSIHLILAIRLRAAAPHHSNVLRSPGSADPAACAEYKPAFPLENYRVGICLDSRLFVRVTANRFVVRLDETRMEGGKSARHRRV
jgi:hypothetical protein